MTVKGKVNVRTKIAINDDIIQQVSSFNYLEFKIKIAVTNSGNLEWI
jgi:hypothetical protein